MKTKKVIALAREIAAPFIVTKGRTFRLKDVDPAHAMKWGKKKRKEMKHLFKEELRVLCEMQEVFFAEGTWALTALFQARDAAGKDSTIDHVTGGINPQGYHVSSFKAPTSEELAHDYMWRCLKCLPRRGQIGIFNRSYYEEVLVVRVHEALLKKQRIPKALTSRKTWDERFEDIRNFERYLSRNGFLFCKFFLHVSKKEQKKRLLARIDDPKKNFKFSEGDIPERKLWPQYDKAYEAMIQNTATKHAPWFVIPADDKLFMHLVVASALIVKLASLKLAYRKVSKNSRQRLAKARRELQKT